MEKIVLSCLESRIEENQSVYSRFLLGPFISGHAVTVATALRRALLSEVKNSAITALHIQGITHEFSTLVGVRESVLELSLNFQQIIIYNPTRSVCQVGYLHVQGPAVVYANDLKFPNGIECVNPTQYIATLSTEGLLVVKFLIGEKKSCLKSNTSTLNSKKIKEAKRYSNSLTKVSLYKTEGRSSANQSGAALNKTSGFVTPGLVTEGAAFVEPRTKDFSVVMARFTSEARVVQLFRAKQSLVLQSKSKASNLQSSSAQLLEEAASYAPPLKFKLKEEGTSSAPPLKLKLKGKGKEGTSSTPSLKEEVSLKPKLKLETTRLADQSRTTVGTHSNSLSLLEQSGEPFNSEVCLRTIIPLDPIFTPVYQVNFGVERDDLSNQVRERVIMEVWTNGSIHPRQAIHEAALSTMSIFSKLRKTFQLDSHSVFLEPAANSRFANSNSNFKRSSLGQLRDNQSEPLTKANRAITTDKSFVRGSGRLWLWLYKTVSRTKSSILLARQPNRAAGLQGLSPLAWQLEQSSSYGEAKPPTYRFGSANKIEDFVRARSSANQSGAALNKTGGRSSANQSSRLSLITPALNKTGGRSSAPEGAAFVTPGLVTSGFAKSETWFCEAKLRAAFVTPGLVTGGAEPLQNLRFCIAGAVRARTKSSILLAEPKQSSPQQNRRFCYARFGCRANKIEDFVRETVLYSRRKLFKGDAKKEFSELKLRFNWAITTDNKIEDFVRGLGAVWLQLYKSKSIVKDGQLGDDAASDAEKKGQGFGRPIAEQITAELKRTAKSSALVMAIQNRNKGFTYSLAEQITAELKQTAKSSALVMAIQNRNKGFTYLPPQLASSARSKTFSQLSREEILSIRYSSHSKKITFLSSDLANLSLSLKTYTFLKKKGKKNIGSLLEYSQHALFRFLNSDRTMFDEIEKCLLFLGLPLKRIFLSSGLDDLPLSLETSTFLKKRGKKTIGSILEYSPDGLVSFLNGDEKMLDDIERGFLYFGFPLKRSFLSNRLFEFSNPVLSLKTLSFLIKRGKKTIGSIFEYSPDDLFSFLNGDRTMYYEIKLFFSYTLSRSKESDNPSDLRRQAIDGMNRLINGETGAREAWEAIKAKKELEGPEEKKAWEAFVLRVQKGHAAKKARAVRAPEAHEVRKAKARGELEE